jgi:uncharacterized protein YjiS (DUF1127 family)
VTMSNITFTQAAPESKRIAAALFSIVQAFATSWAQSLKAARFAEEYLTKSDEELSAIGITREQVIVQVRQFVTDTN